jgi:integrase
MTPSPFKRSTKPGSNYYVRFEVDGRAYLWSTKTDDVGLAKKRGKAYRDAIVAKAYGLIDGMKQGGDAPTIGGLIEAYMALPEPPYATRIGNKRALLAVLGVSGITEHDRLARLDRTVIMAYQDHCKKQRPGDLSAISTANANVRKMRSLFSMRALRGYYKTPYQIAEGIARELAMAGLLKEPERVPELPTQEADDKAHRELPAQSVAWRCYLLLRYGGLRAGEAIAARRDWLDGTKLCIGGKGSNGFVTKSRRYRVVELPQQVVDALLLSEDPVYFIGEHVRPQPETEGGRCGTISRREFVTRHMPGILRGLGFPANKPLHSLRRLAGSCVYNTQGPRQARDFLGHQEQKTTDRYYARSKNAPDAIPFAS